MLTGIEKKIIAAIQADIAVTERPYLAIARSLGISEDTLLATLRSLCGRGVIRRFGATLRHQRTGYTANAMVAWKVDESRIDAVGKIMASFRQVSHCYRRNPAQDWPYNLYTMVHAENEAACAETTRQLARSAAVDQYALLFSREELKKTSMVYFVTDDES